MILKVISKILCLFLTIGFFFFILLRCKIGTVDAWIGFLGSFLGAAISGLISFIIWYLQRENDRRQSVQPILNVCQENGIRAEKECSYQIDYCNYSKEDQIGIWCLADEQHSKIKETVSDKSQWFQTVILVENVGRGPAMQVSLDIKGIKEIKCSNDSSICLAENQRAKYTLYIRVGCLSENNFGNVMIFEFRDCYDHKYVQEVKFGIQRVSKKQQPAIYKLTNLLPISNIRKI